MGFFIGIYLAGFALVAVRLGYVMRTQLDEFDWKYHRNNIWRSYVMISLFWPVVLLFAPRELFKGNQLFVYDMVFGELRIQSIAQRMRNLKQFSDSPPPCGKTIYYRYEDVDDEPNEGARHWFESDELVTLYKGKTVLVKSYRTLFLRL